MPVTRVLVALPLLLASQVHEGVGFNTTDSCKCGVKPPTPDALKPEAIVGGDVAEAGEWPWIVVHSSGSRENPVTDGSNQFGCGGTLVADNWVVTAAHCFFNPHTGEQVVFADTMSVVIGEHSLYANVDYDNDGYFDLSDDDEHDSKRLNLEIEKMIIPEGYDPMTQKHDIALLKLKEKLDLNIYTPACLADTGKDWAGATGWVYGWGNTQSRNETGFEALRETSQVILNNTACEKGEGMWDGNGDGDPEKYSMAGKITADMLCAEAPGKDSCQGDSGGPFTVDVQGQHHLVGVVSWGFGCAVDGLPGVYSSVSVQREWIDQQMNENGGATICQAGSNPSKEPKSGSASQICNFFLLFIAIGAIKVFSAFSE